VEDINEVWNKIKRGMNEADEKKKESLQQHDYQK